MLTRALNSLVLLRIGGFRLAHGGGRDGFVPLLIGLAIIGIAIWALSRSSQQAPAKDQQRMDWNLPAPRPPERTNPEVEKHHDNQSSFQKRSVIGTGSPTGSHAPQVWCKDDDRQKEKDAGHFKPDNSAHAPEGTQKPAHAARHSARVNRRPPRRLSGPLAPNCRVSSRLGIGRDSNLGWLRGSGLRRGRQVLTGDASGDAQACAKHAANLLWFHSVYDGSSDAG